MPENSMLPENASYFPRISFSHGFCLFDPIPIEQCPYIWRNQCESSNNNFDFSIPGVGISSESSWSAEEFFQDGKILPKEMKKQSLTRNYTPDQMKLENYKTGLSKPETNLIGGVKPVLEIEEIGRREDEVKLTLLRDDSTGSCSKQKQLQVSSSSSSLNGSFQKPPLKKNYGGYSYKGNGGVIRVSSLLDIIPSGNTFGLESINVSSGSKKIKWRSMFFYW